MKKTCYSILIFIFGFSLLSWNNIAAEGPKAPPFELVSLEGKQFTREDLKGKVTLFIFWASWCHVCQGELPKAHLLNKRMTGKPFQIIAIGFGDEKENIDHYVKTHPDVFSFPVFYDLGNRVSSQFGASVTPTLFLFDKNAELVVPYRGGGLFEHPEFQKVLAELL